jgi:hypothetical protein
MFARSFARLEALILLCCIADNLKMTFPIAATILQVAWAIVSLPPSATVDQAVLVELRWGCEYLLACQISNSTLVTQVCPTQVS